MPLKTVFLNCYCFMQLFYDVLLSTKYKVQYKLNNRKKSALTLLFQALQAAFHHLDSYWEAGGVCVCVWRITNARELEKITASS